MRAAANTPSCAGLEDAQLLIHGTWQLAVEPTARFDPPLLTAIPPYPSLPMEKNYWRVKKTATPGLFLREFGKGRVVYFPWDIDRVYWEVMADDHGRLLRNAIDWALDEARPVTVEGPGVLDVAVWKQKELHDGPPGQPHQSDDDAPQLSRDHCAPAPERHAATAARPPPRQGPFPGKRKYTARRRIRPASIRLTVPSITDHEVIAVDFA